MMGYGMMGWSQPSVIGTLFWVVLLVDLVLLGVWLWKQVNKK